MAQKLSRGEIDSLSNAYTCCGAVFIVSLFQTVIAQSPCSPCFLRRSYKLSIDSDCVKTIYQECEKFTCERECLLEEEPFIAAKKLFFLESTATSAGPWNTDAHTSGPASSSASSLAPRLFGLDALPQRSHAPVFIVDMGGHFVCALGVTFCDDGVYGMGKHLLLFNSLSKYRCSVEPDSAPAHLATAIGAIKIAIKSST